MFVWKFFCNFVQYRKILGEHTFPHTPLDIWELLALYKNFLMILAGTLYSASIDVFIIILFLFWHAYLMSASISNA